MSIQAKDALELSRRWGGKPCNHPNLEKEYYLGTATGDWVCTQCGEAGPGRDWPEREKIENAKI